MSATAPRVGDVYLEHWFPEGAAMALGLVGIRAEPLGEGHPQGSPMWGFFRCVDGEDPAIIARRLSALTGTPARVLRTTADLQAAERSHRWLPPALSPATVDALARPRTNFAADVVIPGFAAGRPVHVVVDHGMPELWAPLTAQLLAALTSSGAGSVEVSRVDTDADGNVLIVEADAVSGLNDHPGWNDGLILVLTDGTSPRWVAPEWTAAVNRWSQAAPTTIAPLLPPRDWSRLVLFASHDVELVDPALSPAAAYRAKAQLDADTLDLDITDFADGIAVPLAPLELVRRDGGTSVSAPAPGERVQAICLPLEAEWIAERAGDLGDWLDGGYDPYSRLLGYRAFAQGDAADLLVTMAAVTPVTIPLLEILQAQILGDHDAAGVPELVLSGFLTPVATDAPVAHAGVRMFDFAPDVRRRIVREIVDSWQSGVVHTAGRAGRWTPSAVATAVTNAMQCLGRAFRYEEALRGSQRRGASVAELNGSLGVP